MLDILGDSERSSHVDDDSGLDDSLLCADCGRLITRTRWRLTLDGDHERVFFNPAGHVFRVLCFREAPGVETVGEPTGEFSWFKGYVWTFAQCGYCARHIGWRYEGSAEPQVFFGLIKKHLVVGFPD